MNIIENVSEGDGRGVFHKNMYSVLSPIEHDECDEPDLIDENNEYVVVGGGEQTAGAANLPPPPPPPPPP